MVSLLLYDMINYDKGASINYVDKILRIFDKFTTQAYVVSLTFRRLPLPLACQRSLWTPRKV